jgi:hypothetical protein
MELVEEQTETNFGGVGFSCAQPAIRSLNVVAMLFIAVAQRIRVDASHPFPSASCPLPSVFGYAIHSAYQPNNKLVNAGSLQGAQGQRSRSHLLIS